MDYSYRMNLVMHSTSVQSAQQPVQEIATNSDPRPALAYSNAAQQPINEVAINFDPQDCSGILQFSTAADQ